MKNSGIWIYSLMLLLLMSWGCADDPTGPEVEDGPQTIQDRVNAASPGDTVLIAPGVYSSLHEYTDFIGRTFLVFCVMKPGVVVLGETGNPADVVIDAKGEGWGFWFYETGDSTGLGDLTVRNALWGISGYAASPWVNNCIIEDNGSEENLAWTSGVGMYFDLSMSRITNCIFRNNEAFSGGGATFSCSSNVRLEGCVFTGNHATGTGGGLVVGNDSTVFLENCSILNNTADDDGGGVYCHGDSLIVSGGTISGNTAAVRGGGIAIRSGLFGAIFNEVEIVDNSAPEGGQGYVWEYTEEVVLICCDTDPEGWVGEVTFDDSDCEETSTGRNQ